MSNKGKLFLIPTSIAANTNDIVLSLQVKNVLPVVRFFLAEDIRTARRYLSSLKVYESIEALSFSVLNKDTKEDELATLFTPVFTGNHIGVISEAGCPGIADPGALAVNYAHRNAVQVVPLVGPSAILLALMASGLNGQNFAFHGYLPIQGKEVSKVIRELEKESRTKSQTQIFIETPYRNQNLFENLVRTLMPETQLSIAVDITGEKEFILTQSVKGWRKSPVDLGKNPAVFLFLA